MDQPAPIPARSIKRPGVATRIGYRVLGVLHPFLYQRGIGRRLGRMPQVLLTTKGRKTGRLHTVPLGALDEGDGWVVIASNNGADTHPGWWLNLLADPVATVQVGDRVVKVRMQEITDPAGRARIWDRVIATMSSYARLKAKTSRVIPLGWLRPVEEP